MAESTGQIDKLIEQKVDDQIKKFANLLTENITHFLKENGDYDGSYFYMVNEWEKDFQGRSTPKTFSHESMLNVKKSIIAGISKQVKDKMITTATKELLEKVKLLG
jgi:hypothetical protein